MRQIIGTTKHGSLSGCTHVDSGPIGRTLIAFALPVLASQLLQELYNITDCAIVGRFAGEGALAATGIAGLLLSVAVNFCIGFSSGISVITARLFGAGQEKELKETVASVLLLAVFSGLLLMAVFLPFADDLLRLLRCPESVLAKAALYLRILSLSLSAQLLYNAGCAILRACGDTGTPLRFFSLSVVINIAGDLLLVALLKRSVAGAAAATAFSQWILALLILRRLLRPGQNTAPAFRDVSLKKLMPFLRRVLAKGVPAGLQALFMSISSLLIQVEIDRFGADAIAGMTVFAKLECIVYLPAFAYGIALTAFVGQNDGAGRPDRIRAAVRLSLGLMTLLIGP